MTSLKQIILGASIMLALNGCSKNYEIVSKDKVSEMPNYLEVCAAPHKRGNEVLSWSYSSWTKKGTWKTIGIRSFKDLISDVKNDIINDSLNRDPRIGGVIIHTHDLEENQIEKIADELGLHYVAFKSEREPQHYNSWDASNRIR